MFYSLKQKSIVGAVALLGCFVASASAATIQDGNGLSWDFDFTPDPNPPSGSWAEVLAYYEEKYHKEHPNEFPVADQASAPFVPTQAPDVGTEEIAVAAPQAAPAENTASLSIGSTGLGDIYTKYVGNGSPEAGWPTKDKWLSFNDLWAKNAVSMARACNDDWLTVPGGKPGNSPHEMEVLRQAILDKAAAGNVDPRFVLAVVLQESRGCVRVHSTRNGVYNPGLMQGHNGQGDCQNIEGECPDEQIHLMIQDGAIGTASGDGLSRILKGANSAQDVYHASQVYNSGSVAASGDLAEKNGATACYASDIANRLTGWVYAESPCHNN